MLRTALKTLAQPKSLKLLSHYLPISSKRPSGPLIRPLADLAEDPHEHVQHRVRRQEHVEEEDLGGGPQSFFFNPDGLEAGEKCRKVC